LKKTSKEGKNASRSFNQKSAGFESGKRAKKEQKTGAWVYAPFDI
jgi:hypothetical protein|tara:strand:- start:421 stop:555 length:135 start_codon:yes stop_codon:yes gene_type:complete